jgi:hypothetical protein
MTMGSKQDNSPSEYGSPRRNDPEVAVLERVQELTWALLDEDISDDEMSLLDTLLLTGESARNRYIECVQLHTDLMVHFDDRNKNTSKSGSNSPVLSFLNSDSSSMDMRSPRTAE